MTDLPLIMTEAGPVPTPPATIHDALIALVSAAVPGYTANLPGSMIDDIAGTDTFALVICDQARVDLINSVSPYGANAFILNQLGQQFGIPFGETTNTSVNVTFTGSAAGFVILRGFTISDGAHQYVVQRDTVIPDDLTAENVFCVATVPGSWAVPSGTVTALVTSVPSPYILTVTNPADGTPSAGEETETAYRARVLEAGLASATGMASLLKSSLKAVSGVQARLVAVRQYDGGWQVIVGGGDPYEVAFAIFSTLFNINDLKPSADVSRNVSVDINDFPDTYEIVFVVPDEQGVEISLLWNTTSPNFVSPASVAALGGPALAAYINGIVVGQPINLFEMQQVFAEAIVSLVPAYLLSRMAFTVTIDGSPVSPDAGTGLIVGPEGAEGYFLTSTSAITISQG